MICLVWNLSYALWLVNLPPPNVPPQKQGFNKALLRDTNGQYFPVHVIAERLERLPPAGLQDSECGAALAGDDTAWGETGGDWWMLCWRQGSIL